MNNSLRNRWQIVTASLIVASLAVAAGKTRREPRAVTGAGDRVGELRPEFGIGPDLVVSALNSIYNYGSEIDPATGVSISAYAVATTACNLGDEPATWIQRPSNQHPVIAQQLYRLKDGRFEQLGLSWLNHGFFAVLGTQCGDCIAPAGAVGDSLGVLCSSPEGAINGVQSGLGPRSTVNAFTGYFTYPFGHAYKTDNIDRRLQVSTTDLDPNLNPGALYFAEGQYVTPDETAWGNQFNNASYRPASVQPAGPANNYCNKPAHVTADDFCLQAASSTRAEQPAIRAWKENDPDVVESDVRIPGEGLFILAAKATNLHDGFWHYEYALYNMNSHRSAGTFTVPVAGKAAVSDIGFHAPFYHSGEPYDNAPWDATITDDAVMWRTTPYAQNENANALRWGTLYNFRLDSDQPPSDAVIEIGLFRPGEPASIFVDTVGPAGNGAGRVPHRAR